LWAVGFEGTERAAQVQDEITRLAREEHDFNLLVVAIAVRYPAGSLTLNGEPFPLVVKSHRGTVARFLPSLALGAPPLSGMAVGTLLATTGFAAETAGISDHFVREVEGLIKPGASVLFVLDNVGDLDAILPGIRGLGGIVLKTNVDIERARTIQSALGAAAEMSQPTG
jgi:uncharacterized membrane protein